MLKRTVRCSGGGANSVRDGEVGLRGKGEEERVVFGSARRFWIDLLVGDDDDDDTPLPLPLPLALGRVIFPLLLIFMGPERSPIHRHVFHLLMAVRRDAIVLGGAVPLRPSKTVELQNQPTCIYRGGSVLSGNSPVQP